MFPALFNQEISLVFLLLMMEFSILGLKHIYIKDKEAQVDVLDEIYVKKKLSPFGNIVLLFPPGERVLFCTCSIKSPIYK